MPVPAVRVVRAVLATTATVVALALLPARAPAAPPTAAPAARDTTRADDVVRDAVLRNSGDVRRCYEREGLAHDAALRGTVELELTILPTGTVERATVRSATLSSPAGGTALGACIATAARHWTFERGPYAIQTLIFPFRLAPLDRPPADSAARPATRA